MSDGLIDITYFATGELMASGEIFDGVTKGMIEVAPAGMGYATGVIGRVQHLDCGGAGYLSPYEAYGMLYDENGDLRIEPLGESIQVHGEANLVLDTPFALPSR